MVKQTKHFRRSKKGRLFRAGRRLFPKKKKGSYGSVDDYLRKVRLRELNRQIARREDFVRSVSRGGQVPLYAVSVQNSIALLKKRRDGLL